MIDAKIKWQVICNKCHYRWTTVRKIDDFKNVKCPKCGKNESLSAREI